MSKVVELRSGVFGRSLRTFLVAQPVKRLPAMLETRVRSLGREDLLEKEMVTHPSILAWKILWTENPGRLQSMGSQRAGHDWVTSLRSWGGSLYGWILMLLWKRPHRAPQPLQPWEDTARRQLSIYQESKSRSVVSDFATPRTVTCQAPLFMGFFRQEYWSGLPRPPPGDLPNPGI